jgi:hypothetical protein
MKIRFHSQVTVQGYMERKTHMVKAIGVHLQILVVNAPEIERVIIQPSLRASIKRVNYKFWSVAYRTRNCVGPTPQFDKRVKGNLASKGWFQSVCSMIPAVHNVVFFQCFVLQPT